MQTAIDRLSVGKEKEINIIDFDGYRATNPFVCPECGEYVFPAVGKKNSFKHPKGMWFREINYEFFVFRK